MTAFLSHAARVLEDHPRVMASVLAAHRRRTGMSAAVQERWLGMASGALPRLAVCRRLDPASATFGEEVADVAAYVRCGAERLRRVLEQAVTADQSGEDTVDVSA